MSRVFYVVLSLQVSPPKPCKPFFCPAHVKHAPPTRMTFGDEKYHTALQYVIFPMLFLLPTIQIDI